ncbi:MAG: class I tRNA ligase family protein [Patescibacteria group bacterium]
MDVEESKAKKSAHAEREEAILKFWNERNIFEKTLAKKSPKGEFVFYEGPPTANGKPGIHHVESRSFKDALPRYKTMRGYHVRRRAGWDTHGLPVELEVEKRLGFRSKKDIEGFGIAEFNKKCKESVFEYIDAWRKFSERVGYFTDFDNAYFTFHNDYIESLWNIVGKIEKQNLLYKDYRVTPWCTRCGTTLSSHELAQGYQDVKDLSVTVKFHLLPGQKFGGDKETKDTAYLLAWTTTPWTIPGNVALAVGKDISYTALRVEGILELLILASDRVTSVFKDQKIEIVHNDIKGSDLVGLEYEPLYPFLKDNLPESEKAKLPNAFKVYAADFVTTTDGTGIVHTAVMYGSDDFVLGTKVGLPKYHLVKEDGSFKSECGFLAGRYVKEKNETGKPTLDVDIIEDLKKRNLFFAQENYKHSYPHCWRCKTPLLYYARDSWYIAMSKLRSTLVAENEKINWEPSHIKEGRFGEWLREVKDWAISRERYWGTPLPVWISEDGSEKLVVDSIDSLKKHTKKSGNKYFVMRHGGTEGNAKGIVSFKNESNDHLTERGLEQIKKTSEKLKLEKIDFVISSPFARTRETAELALKELGLAADKLIIDARLHEVDPGNFDGKAWNEYHKYLYEMGEKWFDAKIPSGESLRDVNKRMLDALYDLENKYAGKNILIVTHGGPAWVLFAGVAHMGHMKHSGSGAEHFVENAKRFENAEVRELRFVPLPHDENYELDLHKPFIDAVVLEKNGKRLVRTKEVMDVWFDSGAMPFAQDHYPFEKKGLLYPADFISEAIDQTRGWFYTLHAVGALMGRGRAYKNVICLGHLLDKEGKKMSKSIGNVMDPWEQMDKWGVDAIRLWMYSINQPGESKNYDEKTVDEVNKKFFNLVSNVLSFYELYRDKSLESNLAPHSSTVLDKWILVKLETLTEEMTKNLEGFKLLEPVRALREFIDDLSTWYLQLSRDRFRDGDREAKRTLYYVLKTLSKLFAPFAPFYAEDLHQKLRLENDPESVHLEEWPEPRNQSIFSGFRSLRSTSHSKILQFLGGVRPSKNHSLLDFMQKMREIVSIGLDARMKANIKVRQPLASLAIEKSLAVPEEFLDLVKERLNVKSISFGEKTELDLNITEELKEEGIVREIIRFVQDLRKKQGLTPNDRISLSISANPILEKQNWQKMIQDTVLADKINIVESLEGDKLVVEDAEFVISIQK